MNHPASIRVQPLRDTPRVRDFLTHASTDPTITYNTYLPAHLTHSTAGEWIAAQPATSWLITTDTNPLGFAQLTPADTYPDLPLPAGAHETETWLLAPHRGQRIATRAWTLIETTLHRHHPHITHLIAVVWRTNIASLRRLANDGYTHLGDVHWSDGNDAGPCAIYQRHLPASLPAAA